MSVPVIGQVTDEILKMDGTSFNHEIETFDFFFDEVGEVNEVNRCLIEYKGTGAPNLTVEVGTRPNQSASITYSTPIAVVTQNGSTEFFFRSEGVGKFIRFRFRWTNTETNWIDDLRLISLTRVDNATDYTQE